MDEYILKEAPKPDLHIEANQNKTFVFHKDCNVILRLDEQGFHYKGETIDDAGEAYKLFMAWLKSTEQDDD